MCPGFPATRGQDVRRGWRWGHCVGAGETAERPAEGWTGRTPSAPVPWHVARINNRRPKVKAAAAPTHAPVSRRSRARPGRHLGGPAKPRAQGHAAGAATGPRELAFPPGTSPEPPAPPGVATARAAGPVTIATTGVRSARAPQPPAPPRPAAPPRGGAPQGQDRARMRGGRRGRPLPRAGYSQTAPSTPDRRHSQRYHHVMPSSCAGGAELTAAAAAPPEPLMVPPSGAARRPHKALRSRPRRPGALPCGRGGLSLA